MTQSPITPASRSVLEYLLSSIRALFGKDRIADFFGSKLAAASGLMSVSTVSAGILGYVFHILMGRMLSTQEYGLFGAMMALFVVLAAPLASLMMVISRKVSEYRAKEDVGSLAHFYYWINFRTAAIGVLLLVVYFYLTPKIQSYLKAPTVVPVYLLGVLLFLTFLPIINNAFLQGLQRFGWLFASGSLNNVFKIIFSVALVWLGFGLTGAVGGVVLSSFAVWIFTYWALHPSLAQGRHQPSQSAHLSIKPAMPVLIANAAFAAMTQLDMVLVNYYFPAHEAGLYAAASILGKAVMFLPGGIALALFPMVAENQARNQRSTYLLLQAVGLTAFLCGAGAVFYFLFGDAIIRILYGEAYRGAGEVLTIFGFAILPMALVLVAERFLIAKGRVLFAYLFVLFAPLQLLAIHLFHDSLRMVVVVMGASGLLLALFGYGLMWRVYRRS
jgi:O-antigen/teichoic acid export membrane protein